MPSLPFGLSLLLGLVGCGVMPLCIPPSYRILYDNPVSAFKGSRDAWLAGWLLLLLGLFVVTFALFVRLVERGPWKSVVCSESARIF